MCASTPAAAVSAFDRFTTPGPIIFAGGGTGGHLMPGLAIAERLRERCPGLPIEFWCSDKPLDAEILSKAGHRHRALPARPFALRPIATALPAFLAGLNASNRLARQWIRELRQVGEIGALVAMGGYVAAAAVTAAVRSQVPVWLVNLDVVPGLANRMIAGRANVVLSAVPVEGETLGRRVEVVGMPIRRAALASADAAECRRRLGLDPDRRTLLVTGASQGAESLNRFMATFAERRPEALRDWQVIHLAGPRQIGDLRSAYERAGVPAAVFEFLDAMGEAWGAADLALSRAGASSVAEAVANRVPTIFAPYPWHKDQHQKRNAEPLIDAGGAWLVDDAVDPAANLQSIAPALSLLLRSDSERAAAREALADRNLGDAADRIAGRLLHRGR